MPDFPRALKANLLSKNPKKLIFLVLIYRKRPSPGKSLKNRGLTLKSVDRYKALSIEPRRRLLNLLMVRGPLDLEECSKIVGIKPITVRHHLRVLEQAGLVESFTAGREAPGRPKQYYRAVKRYVNLGFPLRRFDLLSEQALKALLRRVDREEAENLLRAEAERMGKELLGNLSVKHGVREWNLENFKRYVLPALEQMGCYPAIEEEGKTINLKFYNCIFHEVSRRFQPLVCNAHEAFIRPLVEAAGYSQEAHETYLAKDQENCTIRFRAKAT